MRVRLSLREVAFQIRRRAKPIQTRMTRSLRRSGRSLLVAALAGHGVLQPQPSSAQTKNVYHPTSESSAAIDLDVGYIPQEKLLGVPTSAAMIMAFYGDPQPPRKLKTISRGRNYVASEPFDDFSITFYWDIVKAAADLGYHWSERTFADTPLGFQHGLAMIKREVAHGRPVMIDVSGPDGHTIVVTGFDEETQSVHVMDPRISAPGRYNIDYGSLQSIWNEHAFNRKFRSLVVTSTQPFMS